MEINFADSSFYVNWDWSAGEAGFRRAYESDPGSEEVVAHYSFCLRAFGRFDEAIEVLESSQLKKARDEIERLKKLLEGEGG